LPELTHAGEIDALGPLDLADRLPHGTAFVHLLRYTDFGPKQKRPDRYVAFVVGPMRTITCVQLQDARPIDEAVRAWREAIATQRDIPADAARVARRVWEPVAEALPPGTTAVYLACDGELARLPWAA
jgi:hypothetical protein